MILIVNYNERGREREAISRRHQVIQTRINQHGSAYLRTCISYSECQKTKGRNLPNKQPI